MLQFLFSYGSGWNSIGFYVIIRLYPLITSDYSKGSLRERPFTDAMKKRIYEIIEPSGDGDKLSKIYDVFMMVTIIVSLIPLAFKETNAAFLWVDYISTGIFMIDYLLRFSTADLKLKKGMKSFFIYPITPMAIIDIVSILPSLAAMNEGLRMLRILRLLRSMKVLRALKFLRYSKSFYIIINVFKKQKKVLGAVGTMALAYILISALIVFNAEPEAFNTFFDAVYWATISLTTVGYGDIYPVTTIGRVITMVSSIFGVAIIALPSGVITAGYLAEFNEDKERQE